MKAGKRASRKMGGKKGKKGARKTNRKRGGMGMFSSAPAKPLDWSVPFKADRVNEIGLTGYSMAFDPTQNMITVDFNGMGENLKRFASGKVFSKVKELVRENFYPGQQVLPVAVDAQLNALTTTSVVVFQGPVDLISCTIDGTPIDLTGATTVGGFDKLKQVYNDLNTKKQLRNVTYPV